MSTSWIECSSSVPRPRLGVVVAPRRVVQALVGDELVVAEHDGEDLARARVLDQVVEPAERRQVPQHEAHLVDDPGRLHRLDHADHRRGVGRQGLLAEHRDPRGRGPLDQARVLGGPGADVDRVHVPHQLLLAGDRGAVLVGERPGALGVRVMDGHDGVVDATAGHLRGVVAGDEPRAVEPHSDRHEGEG
jgi:hypothetical protein